MISMADRRREQLEYAASKIELPTTPAEAGTILASDGGKKAARRAVKRLWEEVAKQHDSYYVENHEIEAPRKVMASLILVGLIEDVTIAENTAVRRYQLTEAGCNLAMRNVEG